ncbi:MAG: hypothetical protein ACYCX2_08625 [Christensenellales bacterium]
MIRAGELNGIAIWDEHAQKIGVALRAVYSPGEKRIRGILYKPSSSLKRQRFLPVSNIVAIDRNALVIKGQTDKTGIKPDKQIEEMVKAQTVVYAKQEEMGRLSDYFIDFRGFVKAIEVSRSFLDDLLQGRKLETEFGELAFENYVKRQKNNQKE